MYISSHALSHVSHNSQYTPLITHAHSHVRSQKRDLASKDGQLADLETRVSTLNEEKRMLCDDQLKIGKELEELKIKTNRVGLCLADLCLSHIGVHSHFTFVSLSFHFRLLQNH